MPGGLRSDRKRSRSTKSRRIRNLHLYAVEGTVEDIGYVGHLTTYHVKLKSGQIIKAQDSNSRQTQDRAITWEDEVWLSWYAGDGVLLRA